MSPARRSRGSRSCTSGTALLSALHHLLLPPLTLGFAVMAPLTRMVRATMLEILESDYVNAAWAAGLPRRRVIYGDALRNALIPVITLLFVAPARAKPPRFTGRAAGPVGPPEDPGPARENGGRRGGRWYAGIAFGMSGSAPRDHALLSQSG